MLYKKHMGDVFIESVQQLSKVIRVVNEFLAGPEANSQSMVFLALPQNFVMAQDALTALFELYKEGSSPVMVRLLLELAPQILQTLVQGMQKADDPSYFQILSDYAKYVYPLTQNFPNSHVRYQ